MEDYKKKYEQALERAKKYLYDTNKRMSTEFFKATERAFMEVFPELKESDDERIRKALIHYFSEQDGILTAIHGNVSIGDILAWLEKQGEQKPTDKVEPKFKVGDFIINEYGFIMQINGIDGNMYVYHVLEDNRILKHDITKTEESCHLWTIQDAKDDDVLATHLSPEGDWIGIYKQSVDILGFKTYCFLNGVGEFVTNPNRCRNHGIHGLHPATKEQHDLLFAKMKEAGYEWDVEKKELKKIEQKYVWSEEDERNYESAIWHIEKSCGKNGNVYNWLKSIKERYAWKPSEEQMKQLGWIAEQNKDNMIGKELMSLYQDLKKLKN